VRTLQSLCYGLVNNPPPSHDANVIELKIKVKPTVELRYHTIMAIRHTHLHMHNYLHSNSPALSHR